MRNTLSIRTVSLVAAMGVLLLPSAALAQNEAHQHDPKAPSSQTTPTKTGQMKMGQMHDHPAEMEAMAAKRRANTERLTALMATLNASGGDGKVAAMADVIAILLEERAAMQEHCASMHAASHK